MGHLTEDLALKIRQSRERRYLSQRSAAAELGVSVRTLQEWESGRAFPQIRHREKVAAFLRQAA